MTSRRGCVGGARLSLWTGLSEYKCPALKRKRQKLFLTANQENNSYKWRRTVSNDIRWRKNCFNLVIDERHYGIKKTDLWWQLDVAASARHWFKVCLLCAPWRHLGELRSRTSLVQRIRYDRSVSGKDVKSTWQHVDVWQPVIKKKMVAWWLCSASGTIASPTKRF